MNIRILIPAVTALLICGCVSTEYIEVDRTMPPYFHPKNFRVSSEGRDALPRRVMVLPSFGKADVMTLRDIDELLVQELTKANAFEVVLPSRADVQPRRNEEEFTLEEALPWAAKEGADGILICRITSCSPHRPLLLGTAMKLWNIPKQTMPWAIDETLDSQLTLVANGARNYYLSEFRAAYPNRRSESILESPRMFFQYVFSELFTTLPGAPKIPENP